MVKEYFVLNTSHELHYFSYNNLIVITYILLSSTGKGDTCQVLSKKYKRELEVSNA